MKLRESSPSSSPESTGALAERSPRRTRSVTWSRSRTGAITDRVTSSVSSSEIVKATTTATATSSPRAPMCPRSEFESPLTTTPVTTLISGSAPSSFQRSGAPTPTPENESGRWGKMSSITGRSASSEAKKWRIAA